MKILFFSFFLSLSSFSFGQIDWQFVAKKIADKTYEIRLKAKVDEPWHIYSQSSPKGGPLPTKIVFNKNPLVLLDGKAKEVGELDMYHDNVFDVDVYSYKDSVDFVQIVKLKTKVKTTFGGTVEFMACTHEQCLAPQKIPFTLKLE